MRFFEASKCCFCVDDLIIAGYVIGGMAALSILNYCQFFPPLYSMIFVTYAGIWCAWIYGIYDKRSDFMLPALVLSFASLCAHVIFLIYLVIVGIWFLKDYQEMVNEVLKYIEEHYKLPLEIDLTPFYIAFLIIMIIATVLQWHFTSVMCSVLKRIKQEQYSTNTNTTANQYGPSAPLASEKMQQMA